MIITQSGLKAEDGDYYQKLVARSNKRRLEDAEDAAVSQRRSRRRAHARRQLERSEN
jgi:hypothetical protein